MCSLGLERLALFKTTGKCERPVDGAALSAPPPVAAHRKQLESGVGAPQRGGVIQAEIFC